MTIARSRQLCLEQTTYYHCTSRCVRRAFLCGKDRYTGRDFSHRRKWIEERIAELASVFAIEVLAYAIMSNHFHVVLRVSDTRARKWSDDEVFARWSKIFRVHPEHKTPANAERWRERLFSISWYMRCINEPLARWANREDDCVGRFWQGRFRLQALLDENAVLKCMAYVDLNPVRAGLSKRPECSDYTSIKARVAGEGSHLVPCQGDRSTVSESVWFSRQEYFNLVAWTATNIRLDQTQSSAQMHCPPILKKADITSKHWLREISHYGKWYYRAVGSFHSLERYRMRLQVHWLKGMGRARAIRQPNNP